MADDSRRWQTGGIVLLALLAIIAALYFGAEFLVPIALAVVLDMLLRPVIRLMQRAHVPAPAGATVVVMAILGVLLLAGFALVAPVRGWAARAPEQFSQAQQKLARFRRPVQKVTDAAHAIEDAAQGPTTAPGSQPTSQPARQSPPASGASPNLLGGMFGTTTRIVGGATEVVLLLFLLLASGDRFHQKLIRAMREPRNKRIAEESLRESEAVVRRYLLVTAIINAGQGVVVALVMWWIGMPTPVLWGIFTFVLEFIPYLGAVVMIILLAATALTTFDGIGRILLAPGSYLVITTLQNNLVSPIAYGNRLKLNPVVILIGVLFWWYVWGVVGAFLAVPLLAMFKIVADRLESLKPIGEFLDE